MPPRKTQAPDPLESPDPGMVGQEPEGFWTRDEQFGKRLDEAFLVGEMFLCHEVTQGDPFVDPESGTRVDTRSWVVAQGLDPITITPVGFPERYSTFARPIYDRAGKARDGDFPSVVKLSKVGVKKWATEATVLTRVAPWPIPAAVRLQLGVGLEQMTITVGSPVTASITTGDDLSDALEAAAADE